MSSREDVVDLVCRRREEIPLALTVLVTMGLLLAFSLLFVSPGDDAFPIVVIDAALLVGSLLFFGGAYYYCIKREMDDE